MEERMTAISKMRLLLGAPVMLGAILVAPAVNADPIPQEWLQNQHKSCLEACTKTGVAQDTCESNCTCYENETAKSFTSEEYMSVTDALANKQQPSQASIDKMTAIANKCRSQGAQ
jgi:hypothetical protein